VFCGRPVLFSTTRGCGTTTPRQVVRPAAVRMVQLIDLRTHTIYHINYPH
jgi:hypothetical protein